MTEPTLIHRTSDGRCADSGKKRLRTMLVDWTEQHENTVTEYGEAAE